MDDLRIAIQRELETHRACIPAPSNSAERVSEVIGFHRGLHWVLGLLASPLHAGAEPEERVKKLARNFAQEWLRPNDPDHATTAMVDTLSTAMLAFYACAKSAVDRAALSSGAEPEWQPMEMMPEDRQVIVCWSYDSFDTISRKEYLEIMGYGEPPAKGWMSLPPAPLAALSSSRTAPEGPEKKNETTI